MAKRKGDKDLELDIEVLEVYGYRGAKIAEIARLLDCSPDAIEKNPRFRKAYDLGFTKFKIELREKQIELAKAGNATMLIWLGKQYLEQVDKQEIEHSAVKPIIIERLNGEKTILTSGESK